MSLANALRQKVMAFLRRDLSLAALEEWMTDQTPELVADPEAEDLASDLWILIGEHDYTGRSEDSIREELAPRFAGATALKNHSRARA